jgi:hydroxyethylthiazole kinase-like uncharacterized protein yjeF
MEGIWTNSDSARMMRAPTPADDKYSRGVVGLRTGSLAYPGAAVLGVEAAWRTGVGMVRYVGPDSAGALVLARRPETVTAAGRVQAWVIGSGTDAATRSDVETAALRGILSESEPVVVDAGALDLVVDARAPLVLTPHARELERLRSGLGLAAIADPKDAARQTAVELGQVLLLKGARTHVASPSGLLLAIDSPTSWLAVAGTGDVLAGVLGALIAGAAAGERTLDHDALTRIAATASWVHGHAARRASQERGGGPITALDVADALPPTVATLLMGD